jgi:hypothetical protein
LAEHNNCHALDVEPQVTDADANNDEWGNDAAVDGDSAAESSVPQSGDGPKNDCDRGGRLSTRMPSPKSELSVGQ